MTVFLTSHIGGYIRQGELRIPSSLMTDNGLIERLRERWPARAKLLIVAADPDNVKKAEVYRSAYAFPFHGLNVEAVSVCDSRDRSAAEQLTDQHVILLSGGHVPTQNRFFRELGLKEKLSGFKGLVIGISAGSMNCAETVYAHPELEGEAADPAYPRFIPGLALTTRMILPHYQRIRDDVLDGLHIFRDIACPDSFGREFLALNDGSYIVCENGTETLYGKARRIRDGQISLICRNGESLLL